ncbi:TRAP-type C4-dicarboxylate transport system substrate-binding protein [Rhodoligotrophos appendicifer]|uniref:TRAP transporter substrate-binding protein n=1 Tax=Rhodoligotrophos appendicifer TaxID=987056 RepID=UPI001184A9FE|nr:TRAP transporter substrate-binding protein DctP [Rhodoligotrophos appendicifer]
MIRRLLKTTVAALSLFASFTTVHAQEKITLRVADHYPVNAPTGRYTAGFFMDEVKKATNGAVEFQYFPAEQMGKVKDLLALTQSGVVDIGFVGPSYVSDKMPLSGVAELPGTFATSCEGTRAYWALARDGGLLDKTEFRPNGVRVLLSVVLPPYQIFTRNSLDGIAGVEGLKLRSGGGAQDLTIRKLGAVPIRLAGPEVYESLARGTLDGVVFPIPSIATFNLQGNLKTGTVGENFGGFAVNYVISDAKWKSLPDAVKNAMLSAGEATTKHACEMSDRDQEPALAKLEAAGVDMKPLTQADQTKITELLRPVQTEWATALDKRGKPGGEVLKAFLAELGKAN